MKNATFKTTLRMELTDTLDLINLTSDTGGFFEAQVKDGKLVSLTQRVNAGCGTGQVDRWVGDSQPVFRRVAEHVAK